MEIRTMKSVTLDATDGKGLNEQKGLTLVVGGHAIETLMTNAQRVHNKATMIEIGTGIYYPDTVLAGFDALDNNPALKKAALIFANNHEEWCDIKKENGVLVANTFDDREYRPLADLVWGAIAPIKVMLEPATIKDGTIFYQYGDDFSNDTTSNYNNFWNYMIKVHEHTNNNIVVASNNIACARAFVKFMRQQNVDHAQIVRLNLHYAVTPQVIVDAEIELALAKAILGV